MADQSAEAANAADPGHSQNPDPQAQQVKRPQDNNATFLRAARAGNLDQVLEFLRNGININTSNSNGLNALHLASKEGHNEVVRELIRRNADVDAATRKGNTALHIASLAGQDIIVTILVENGANVNAQSTNGFTPLYMAAQENHEAVVRYLLAHNANQALATEDGFTPLAVALQQGHDRVVALLLENDNNSKVKLPALHIAAKKDDTRAAGLLLQSEQNPNVTSKSGFTPLHISAHYGNENVAQLLIEKGANVNYQARHNISPLHVAAKWGRVNLVKLLLQNGAVIDCRTRDLLTPLHCAARSGHELVVDLLLEQQAPIGAKTKNGLAPLHMAAQGDHVDCARNLLYHQAPVDDVTVDYLTPLHVAAHCGHVQAAKLLLDRHADPNARALNGFTPLHIACKKNRIQVVELLLKYYASLEATTESGLSPLHVASFMGCISIVIYLIQQGAKVDVETVRGETPLHLAARANQTDIVRVLVRNGAKVDAQARELQTPLHIASRLGNTDIVHILLNANADPNAASRDEYTALHIAAKEDKEEVAQILLDHKANKSALTRKGFTPLHLASKYGNYNVAKLLLEGGTPVDIEGKNQVTPLHVAAHYNNDRVAQLLLENGAFAQATAKNGYTPLHIAAKKNQMDIASALLSYKADPNATSKAGFTPLHLASESGHTEMSGLLIENGSMVNARANNGLTPLHLCAQEDNVDAARVLLSNRAEVNAQTKAGYTPLHVACHFGQLNMVRLLIEHGALVSAETTANYTPLHQAAQQGHNSVVRYLLEHGASPNSKTVNGQTPLSIAQRLGYVSVVETLKTVTETTVITETTTVTEERYKPQNPERMNETMFSDSEDEVDETQASAQDHARDFNESITQGLHDSAVIHLIHTGEQMKSSAFDTTDADLDAVIKRAQAEPVTTAIPDPTFLDQSADDNVLITRDTVQPSFLISFLVDARGGAMRGCRHSGVRVIIPPRKAAAPMRITCRYLRKEKLAHPPPLSEGEALASRILEMGPHSAKFLGPVVLEVPHFASLRGREREIVILRSDDGQHWKEHQLEATEDAVQEVLNESFDAAELQQLDDLHSTRITRILTNDFPMYFAVVTRVRQEVHCVGPEGGVILSSVVPRVQAIFPDGSLTKTIKVSLQAQPIPHETVVKLHGNRVAVSPIVTVEPRRRKFHKPITLCIPLPQSGNKGMLTQYANGQPGQEPPTLRLLCSITGGSSPAQWEDITGTTQLTFTGEEVSFTTTVSARFWLMDCQTPRDAARMAQEVYADSICVPYMAKFVVFARRPFPIEGQLRLFCMTDDREDKTLEKQEGFIEVAKSRDVEVLSNRHQFLEFAGNLVPITKSGDQLSVFFLPFQENRLGFNVKVRQHDDQEAATTGRIAIMKEARIRAENIPPQHPICTLSITLPDYRGQLPPLQRSFRDHQAEPIATKYAPALSKELDPDLATQIDFVTRKIGGDWMRMSRSLGVSDTDTRQIKREMVNQEPLTCLKIWSFVKGEEATIPELHQALRRIGRDDIVHKLQRGDLDSDSLRLIDSSNLHLDRTSITSRDDVRAVDRSPAVDVQTTVTRTERYVHKSPESAEPVVDERTVTRVIRDNATVEEVVSERQALPLNEQERDHWMRDPNEEIEAEELFHNSREAMVINDFQETPDGFVETTTLVTQHVIPEAEPTAAVVPEVQAMEMREHTKTPQPSTHEPSPIVDETNVESPSDKLPTPQREESESAMETSITESIVRHEETSKAEPSSIERDLTPQHDDESPHHMQESMIVEETEEEHEPSPAVASEPEPHLRGEERGDSIDITLDDQFSELSAILETTEPLSEHDSAVTENRTVNSVGDADEKTEPADLSHTLKQLETTHVPSFDDPIAQSAEIDAIAAGLTPAENEEVLTEVQLIEQTAEAPTKSSVGSMDIEEIIHYKHMEDAKEEPRKETELESTAKVENEVQVEEKTNEQLQEPQSASQQKEESTSERSNQRPELETLIEQLTEGYDRSQPEDRNGSFDQPEDPEIPEDAIEDNLPQQSAENDVATDDKNDMQSTEQTFAPTNKNATNSPIQVEPRFREDGFLEDASLSEHNQSTDKIAHLNSPNQTENSNTSGLFVWSALTVSGLPVINGLCIRNRVDFDTSSRAIGEETDEPDQSENKDRSDETDESTQPQREDQLPDVGQNRTDEKKWELKGEKETEKHAETSALNLISMTPVESATEDATKVVTPEPNSSLLLAPRSPAPFVLPPETAEQVAVGQLVIDIDAPIEKERLPVETPAAVVNRPAAKEERKPRRSVDLPATPLSFHSFSSAAQIYAPVSPPLRQAIGAVDSSRISQPTAPSTRSSTIPLNQRSESRPTDEVNQLVSGILTRLRHLQMADPPKYANIVERLHALESEMSMQNTGVPADPELTELVGRILAVDYPQSDLQIVVSTSRKTTSTTQFYETETPGMVGLAPEQLRELQQKLMNKISGTTDYGTALKSNEQPDGLKQRNATEEAWTSADGNEAVTKRTIRQSTTTHSGITGAGDHELKDDSDTSSSSSVRDRIQRFESLKQTTAPTSTRRTISIVEEQQSTTEAKHEVDHSFPRPTEIDVQPQEKVVETVEHTDSNVPETPTASVTVEELVEQIGSATTVSTPPKELEVSASPTESRTSVHSLIQKFSHPKENVNESHKEDEQKIAHEPTKEINEESTIIEHYEYQPATHAEQLQTGIDSVRFVTEDVAQQMTREPPSTKTNEPVELIEEISTSPSVLVAEQQQKRTVESAVSMESDHDYQENDEYKHEPSSINATQHELAFDMATHQTLSDTEHKLPTNVGIEENIEATDESSRHTRSVPIQRLATGELVDEDRATAEGQATQPLLSPSETSSEKKESVSISQEIAYNKETVEKPQTHEVERVSPIPIYRQTELADMMPTPEIDANAGRVDRGQEDEDQADFESTTHQKTIPIQGAVRHEFVGGESHLYNPNAVRSESSVDLMHEMDEHKDKKPIEERRTSEDESRLGTIPAIAAGAAGAIGTVIIADCITTENEPTETIVSDYHDISPDHPKDFDEIEHTKLEKVEKFEPNVDEAQAKEIEEALVREIVESDRPNDVPVAAIRRESTIDEHPENEEQPLVSYSDDEQTVLRAVELPDYDVPAEVEYIPIERSAEEMIEGDLLFRPDITNDDSKLTESASEQSIRSTNTVIHVKATEEQSEELLSTPETPQTEVQIGLPPSMSGSGLQDEVNTELAGEQQRFPIQELATQEFVPTDTDIDISVSASNEFAYEASPEDSVEHSIPTKEFHQENVFVESERSTSPRKEDVTSSNQQETAFVEEELLASSDTEASSKDVQQESEVASAKNECPTPPRKDEEETKDMSVEEERPMSPKIEERSEPSKHEEQSSDQSIGLGTMIVGGAALGAKKLFDAIRGEPKDEDDNVESTREQLDTTVKQESHVSTPEESEQELARDIVETEQISLEEQPPHEKQTPAKDNTPVETPLSTEEQPVVRNEEKKIPEMEIQETFDRKSDQFESIEVDVAIPEYAEHNETIVVSSPVVETSTAESPAIHESEPQFVTQELHFEAHEQTGEKPTDFNVTEIERPFEQKETIKSDEPPQQKTQEELTSGLLQTDESSSQTPISLATVDTMPSEAKDMKSNEMVDISPTEEDVPVISEALESVVDVETDDYRVREQTAELIAQKIDIEIAADKPPQTPTPDEYSQELIHEKESEEMAELVAGGIASLIVEEPALTESHHEVKSDEYLDSDKIHQESETKVHIENESTVVESTIQTEIIREVTPTTEFTADVESPLIESHETVPLSPKLEEMVSEPTTERTENIVEEVHDESKIKEENVEHSIEERATTIEIETKPKTPDDEYLHEFTRESIVVPAAHEQSTELIQSEGKVTEMPEETHSTHEFVSQDKHSEKSEPKDAQATEEQSSADSKIGIGTMILGAAVIGAKTAIDKIAEQLPQSSTEEHGYQEISEKADVSTPTSDVLTENTMQQKPQEHQRPTELVGEHSVEERDLDLQSPVSIASVPQDESGRIALDPMQQSIYVTGEEDDKVFGQTPTIIEGETEPLILSDIRKHRLESDIMEQSIYESPHKDEQAESPHLVETTRTPSPVLSRHEEFETTQLETPIKHSKLESHIETEHQFTDDGERVESSSIVYTPEFEHRQFSVSSPKRIDSIDELNEKHESVVVEEDIETPKDIKSENIIAYGQSERASPVQEVTIEKTVREKFHHESEDLVGSEDFQPKPTEQQSPLTEDVEFTQKPEPDELVESEEIAQPEVISTKSPTRMESPILQKTDEKLSPTTEFESHDLIESEDIASEPSNLEDPLSNLEKQSTDSKTKDDRESPSSDRNIGLGMMVTGAAVLGVQAVGEQIKKLGDKLQEGFTGDSKSDDEIVESEEYDRLDSTSKTTTHNVVEHSTKSEDLPTPDDIVESENIRESPEEHIASPTPEHHSTITYDEPTIPIESEFTTNELVESKEIISPIIEAVKPDDTPTVVEEELVESENIDVKKKESSPPHEVIITKTETPSLNVPEGEAEQWSIESLKSFPMTGNNEIKTETGRVIPEENVAIKFVTDEEPIVGEHAEYIVDSEAIEENQPTKGRRYSVEVSEQQAESLATDIVERDDVEHGDYSQRPESPSVQEATQLIEKTEHIGQTAKELVESEEVEIEPSLKSEAFDQSAELKSEQKPAEQFAGEVVETEAITEMPANREDERQSEMILDVGSLKTPKKHQTFDEFPQDQDLVESESVDQSEEQIYEVPKDEVSLLSPTDGPEIVESEDVRYSPEVLVESPRLTPSAPSMSPTEIQEVEQTVERTESSIKTESPIAEDVVESNEIDTSITDKNPMEESTAEEKTLIQFDTPREELKTEEMIELNDEPSKTTPQEPEREELSEAIDEQLDKSDEKVGLGTIIAGAVAIGAKTIGEKLEEFGDKLEEKFVAPQKDEEERTDEQTVPSSQQKEDTIIERENTPTVEWPSSTVEDQRPIVEKQSSTSGEEYLTDQKELSAQAIEEYVLEPISSSEIPRSSTEVDEKLKATTAEMPVDVNAAPLITEPDAAIVKPTPQPETGSNESLDGSEELESERIQQLNEPIKKIPETMQPSNEIPDEPSPIMEVKPSHLNDEEVELLDDTTGYFGHSDEESYLTQETTQPTVLTEELTTETAHEELEVPVSHRELTPEDDFELVPREEEMIVNESPDLALPDQRAVSESPVESIPPDTQSPKPSELSSEHEKVESEHAHDSQQKTVSEDELARRDSDHTQHMETAERIAREAVESGTYESQFHMDGIEVPSGEQTTETKRTTPSESPLLIVEEEVELPNEPTSRATIDYSRLMQERSDSAGTEVGRDRPFTSEDFGGEVPENLQEGSDDEMKPSKEFFGEARDFTTDQNLKFEAKSSGPKEESEDDELADFDVVEQNEADEAAKATGTGGLMVEEIAVRPRSPIPPRWQSIDQSGGEPTVTTSVTPLTIHETESIPESAETDVSVILVRKPGEIGAHRKSDDGSESSLQEFERLELEVKQPIPVTATASATAIGTNGSPTSVGEEEVADMIVSATGSLNSLAEFESLEREVLEEQMVAAGGAEVMILSDIREESEVEEMSVREDDDEADSLNELQERAAAAVDAVAMITSADSLEPSAIPPSVEQAISAAIEAGHRMETSVDSLDAVRPTSHADDSLLEGVSHQENQSQDTQAALSQETAATFQEYHEDDRDSLEGVIEDYPTTLTTYETIQTTDDGSTETITRRVLTRVTDPVHSHIRFTGTENEDRLRNIQPEERIESVDEEGNITTTVRRRTPTLPFDLSSNLSIRMELLTAGL